MAVNIKKLQEQLMGKIDTDDLVEVEKVERYISLVKLNRKLDKEIREQGAIVITENGAQRFVKSHPAVNDKTKVNTQLLAIEKTFNFVNVGISQNEKEPSADDLI